MIVERYETRNSARTDAKNLPAFESALDAAERIYLGPGIGSSSLASLALEGGLREPDLTPWFDSAEDLAVAAITRRFENWSRRLELAWSQSVSPADGLLCFFEAKGEGEASARAIGRLLVRDASRADEASSAISQAIRNGLEQIRGRFQSASEASAAINPVRLASSLGSLWIGAAMSGQWDDARESARALILVHGPVESSTTSTWKGPGAAAARQSEARFQAVFDGSPICIGIYSSDGRPLQANEAWERRHGPISTIGRQWNLLENRQLEEQGLLPLVRKAFEGEALAIAPTFFSFPGPNGLRDEFWSQGFIYPIKEPSGTVREVVVMHQDITDLKEAEQLARGQAEVLRRMLDALAAGHELDPFLGQVVEALAEQLGADSAALWLANEDDGSLQFQLEFENGVLTTATEFPELVDLRPYFLPTGPEALASLGPIRSVGYEYIEDVADPRLIRYHENLAARGVRTLLALHLFLGDERVGVISLRNRHRRRYRPEEITLALGLGRLATLAIRLTRLADGARSSGVLQERNRIAREIHDTLAQGLAAITLQLEACEFAMLVGPPEEARRQLDRARDQARRCLSEARHSVGALRAPELQRADLNSALPEMLNRLSDDTPVKLRFRIEGKARPLPSNVEDELLRIAQEATNNALKHANASEVRVELGFDSGRAWLAIEDDGTGIEPQARRAGYGSGFGLLGMKDRANQLGGRLTIGGASNGGPGTRIVVEVPLNGNHPRGFHG